MIVIPLLVASLVPFAQVGGMAGCWALPTRPGRVCIRNEILNGQLSNDVRYTVISNFTRVCCEALACTDFRGCRLLDIGCGQGTTTSQRLPWELRDINPLLRCYSTEQTNPGFYDFVAKIA